jgi:drug/metabolite transporter (DMT)-like permease
MGGLLYLASAVGLGIYALFRSATKDLVASEAPLTRHDLPWLAGATFAGGMLAPVLLMWGLARTPASTASLLLNVEGIFTASLAWFVFKESFSVRLAIGLPLIAAGGVCLSWVGRPEGGLPWGSLAIVGACFGWALDNNLTRKISAGDPVQIAIIKGVVAGAVNFGLALMLGAKLPGLSVLLKVGVIGFLGYGVSLAVFVLALRHIGAARTAGYFSTAPFVGAVLSILFLGDRLTVGFGLAAILMGIGVWLYLTEWHEHEHKHQAMEHNHLHSHDEHHQHSHLPDQNTTEPHSHLHQHAEIIHTHPHYPEIHHRHKH